MIMLFSLLFQLRCKDIKYFPIMQIFSLKKLLFFFFFKNFSTTIFLEKNYFKSMGYVYLIQEETDENKYKIGMTNRTLEKRMNSLQTGNPNKLTLISYYESKNPKAIETTLHRLFSSKKVLGEWFDLTEDDIKKFNPLCEQIEQNIKTLNSHNPFTPYKGVEVEQTRSNNESSIKSSEKEFLKNLGKKIKDIREEKHISLSELGEKTENTQEYLLNLEKGNKNPNILTLHKIAKVLNVEITDLLN